jgi:hypothetical protein
MICENQVGFNATKRGSASSSTEVTARWLKREANRIQLHYGSKNQLPPFTNGVKRELSHHDL